MMKLFVRMLIGIPIVLLGWLILGGTFSYWLSIYIFSIFGCYVFDGIVWLWKFTR